MMADLHFFGGEKGGVGKSMVCRAALAYHLDRQLPFTAFDTDRSNPDVMRIYGEVARCKVAVFSEGARYEDTANILFNSAVEQRTLCNLPAQVYIPVKEWIEKNELLELAAESGVTFYQWHVSDCGSDSLKLFARSVKQFGDAIPHIFVRNYGMTDDWDPFDSDEELQALVKQYNVTVLDFPKFIGNRDRNKIDDLSLTFADAAEYQGFGPISRQRVKKFLRQAYQAFECAEVFTVAKSDAPKAIA